MLYWEKKPLPDAYAPDGKEVYLAHEEEFDPNRTLGVITPYRSQIALIRKELQALAIPAK